MSVINQMLKDLDARGQGEGAARAAALAATGQGRAGRPRVSSGWDRLPLLALGLMAVMLAAVAWWAWPSRDLGEGVASVDTAVERVADGTASRAAAPPETPLPSTVAETTQNDAPLLAEGAAPIDVLPPASAPKEATPEPEPAPPVDRKDFGANDAAPASESPPVAPAPVARSNIEVLDTPALDRWVQVRDALGAGEAEAALRLLEAAGASEAQEPEAIALRATALQQLSRHEAAIEAWTRALRRSPDIGAWWGGLGLSLDALGRGDEALAAYREARRRGPLDPALADYLDGRVEALSAADPSR